jgi:hypothetical protein
MKPAPTLSIVMAGLDPAIQRAHVRACERGESLSAAPTRDDWVAGSGAGHDGSGER